MDVRRSNIIAMLLLAGLAILFTLGGEGLRYLGDIHDQQQRHFLSKIYYFADDDPAPFGEFYGDDEVQWFERHRFFAEQLDEPPFVAKVKQALPGQLEDRYFENVWNLLSYIELLSDTPSLQKALLILLQDGVFQQAGPDCVDNRLCTPMDPKVNVIPVNMRALFKLLTRSFMDPAIEAFRVGDKQQAGFLANAALTLTKLVHTNPDRRLDDYDRILVIGAFLADKDHGDISADDLDNLSQEISYGRWADETAGATEGSEDDQSDAESLLPPTYSDPRLSAYQSGLQLLYGNCPAEASDKFFAFGQRSKLFGPVRELFAFLSLRALAQPFLFPERLVDTTADATGLAVPGCNGAPEKGLLWFRKAFEARKKALTGLTFLHTGYQADIDFYAARVSAPLDELQAMRDQRAAELAVELHDMSERPEEQIHLLPFSPGVCGAAAIDQVLTREDPGAQDYKPWLLWPQSHVVAADFTATGGNGIEIEDAVKSPVRASDDGSVELICRNTKTDDLSVFVRYDGLVTVSYSGLAHVSKIAIEGYPRQGELLGWLKGTRLRVALYRRDKPLDPVPWFKSNPRPPEPEVSVDVTPSETVKTAQISLVALGFLEDEPDGVVGSHTTRAVKVFQHYYGLPVDGQITETLVSALQERVSARAPLGLNVSIPPTSASSSAAEEEDSEASEGGAL